MRKRTGAAARARDAAAGTWVAVKELAAILRVSTSLCTRSSGRARFRPCG
jgi:hypothetical protein